MTSPSPTCEPRKRSNGRSAARLTISLLILTAALLVIPGLAYAVDTICTGSLLPAGSPYDNVVVPAGENCSIIGTTDSVRVKGNVTVFGSLLVVALTADITIGGNVTSKDGCGVIEINGGGTPTAPEPAPSIAIARVVIGGNVKIENCQRGQIGSGGPAGPESFDGVGLAPGVLIGKNLKCSNNASNCTVIRTVVGGNVDLSGNGGFVNVDANLVGGNVTANNNGGAPGFPDAFTENAIGGDLKCNGNAGPVVGGSNTVAGTKQGQCASL